MPDDRNNDKPDDTPDDMNNPAFSPRQLGQLDEKLENRGFNKIQLEQLDEKLDEKLDSRGFNAVQLKQLDERGFNAVQLKQLDEKLVPMEKRLHATLYADLAHLVKSLGEDLRAEIRASFDPHNDVPKRVKKLEDANLPTRVETLERAVFPPPPPAPPPATEAPPAAKPQRRKRG